MNKSLNKLALVGALSALGLAACGGGGPALDENSPEAQAYIYRNSIMQVMAHEMGILNGMARGEMPANDDRFKMAATDVATLSALVPDAFMAMGIPAMSRAMPAIWQNMDDFKMKAMALEDAAKMVSGAAQSGGVEGAKGSVQQLAQTCGGCHRMYRKPEEE